MSTSLGSPITKQAATPSIWSPIGDFFGFFGGAKTFKAYPLGIGLDGFFYSNWYMPFAARAKIEIVNDGGDKVPIHCEIATEGLRFPVSAYGRFHAKWHRDAFLPVRPDGEPDWTVLATRGRGRYVGLHLHVWNPGGGWWEEGYEKFFVDGEKFPSEFGSEGYFGYTWSSPGLFSRPFHNQVLNERNAGHIINNRWHFADSVGFKLSSKTMSRNIFQTTGRPCTRLSSIGALRRGTGSLHGCVSCRAHRLLEVIEMVWLRADFLGSLCSRRIDNRTCRLRA